MAPVNDHDSVQFAVRLTLSTCSHDWQFQEKLSTEAGKASAGPLKKTTPSTSRIAPATLAMAGRQPSGSRFGITPPWTVFFKGKDRASKEHHRAYGDHVKTDVEAERDDVCGLR